MVACWYCRTNNFDVFFYLRVLIMCSARYDHFILRSDFLKRGLWCAEQSRVGTILRLLQRDVLSHAHIVCAPCTSLEPRQIIFEALTVFIVHNQHDAKCLKGATVLRSVQNGDSPKNGDRLDQVQLVQVQQRQRAIEYDFVNSRKSGRRMRRCNGKMVKPTRCCR